MKKKDWAVINKEAAEKCLKIDEFIESHSGELELVFKRMLKKADEVDLKDFMFELELEHNVKGFIPKTLQDQLKYDAFLNTEINPFYNDQLANNFSFF